MPSIIPPNIPSKCPFPPSQIQILFLAPKPIGASFPFHFSFNQSNSFAHPQMANKFVSSEQRVLLSRSHVPIRRRNHFERKILQNRFSQELREFLEDPDGRWFLVCGMPGSGKTQMVSDVLWDRPEFCFALIGRLIWLKACPDRLALSTTEEWATFAMESLLIGSLAPNDEEVEQFLGEDEGSLMDEWTMMGQRMGRELANGMADTLLVLDGVVSGETVRFFDEFKPTNCKVMATSTNGEIFRMVDGLRIFRMEEGEGQLDGRELGEMAKCFGMEEELKNVEWILRETGGNLALLDKMFTMAGGQMAIFNSLLANFAEHRRPLREFNCHSTYSYTNLERPIQKCMEMLDHRIFQNFLHCSVLERLVWTPFEIISLVWPLDICGGQFEGGQCRLDGLILQQIQSVAHNSLLDFRHPNAFRLQPLIQNFLLHSSPNSHPIFLRSCQSLLAKLRQGNGNGLEREYLARNEQRLLDLTKIIEKMVLKENGQMNGPNGQSLRQFLNPFAKMFRSLSCPEK